jgi:hypothetical protein
MERMDQPPDKRKTSTVDKTSEENDPFAEIGQEVEASTPAASGTTIPVDFETPSIHMEEAGGDLFDKLGSGMSGAHQEVAGNGERPKEESSEPIQLVEDAANDLFDTLGVEHYGPTAEHQEKEAIDVIDALDTSNPIDLPSEEHAKSSLPPAPTADESGIILDDGGDGDDVFATLASNEDVEETGTRDQPKDTASPAQPAVPAIEIVETEGDALFDNLGAADEEAEPAPSTIELVETEHDSIFDNLGTVEQTPPAESGDSLEEQERKYRLLLEEFGGEQQEFLPESGTTPQAAALFEEDEPTPFDELEPEHLQTASSSTTPPPNLSIENSLQDIEPYEGDTSMVTDTSDWLKDSSVDDQSFQVRDSAALGGESSPVEFEVPYGWYEGDTFHYYTNEQREQVRLAMLESQPQSTQIAFNNEGMFVYSRHVHQLINRLIGDTSSSTHVRLLRECSSAYTQSRAIQ